MTTMIPSGNDSTTLIPFNFGDHNIRIVMGADGEPWFVAKDVATALGYSNPRKAIRDHCKKARAVGGNDSFLPPDMDPQTVLIPEGDVYRLIARSKLPAAEAFEEEVFEKVLPSIRKTGSYGRSAAPALPDFTNPALAARAWADEVEAKTIAIEEKAVALSALEDAREDQDALRRISAAEDTILLSEAAKHFGIGPVKFNRMLHTWGWIFKRPGSRNWLAYEGATRKHFEHKEHVYQKKDGTDGVNTYAVLVPSGLEAVAKKLAREAKAITSGDAA